MVLPQDYVERVYAHRMDRKFITPTLPERIDHLKVSSRHVSHTTLNLYHINIISFGSARIAGAAEDVTPIYCVHD